MLKERDIISLFKEIVKVTPSPSFLLKGIGDDAAVLEFAETYFLCTTDLLVENSHFRWEWMPPFALGYKSLAVNLSDIAAMGGKPECFTVSIGLSEDFPEEKLFGILKGLESIAKKYKVSLIGGDTVRSEKTVINIMVTGRVEKDQVLFRSGAQVGDVIFVSGCLGDAAAGLAILEQGIEDESFSDLIKAQLLPEPEVALGCYLAQTGLVHAMIDISDGIASDLSWICQESGLGAFIHQDLLPISPACKKAAKRLKQDYLSWALGGGEDYRLLFTASQETADELKQKVAEELKREIFIIGEITAGNRVYLIHNGQKKDITGKGYSHFCPRNV
ncbi:MAG: thiamine-phosphate kinase [Candidatus Desulfofervidaceae bacterium]|nr:thiamine-phosphate kinase [Candidatus Desulfofervidaceae bacterium]